MKDFLSRLVAPVIVALLVAASANGAFYQWSKTALTNGSVDSSINWAEGMAPSSINDSARAMMARLAEFRDDTNGTLVTGGTSTAYTLTTNQGLTTTPATGTSLRVKIHVTNLLGGLTLTVDSGNTFPIYLHDTAVPPSGALVIGKTYDLHFNGTAWVLDNYFGAGAKITCAAGGRQTSTSLTLVQYGLKCEIQPLHATSVAVTCQGDILNLTDLVGVQAQLRFGTGTDPNALDPVTGTAVGSLVVTNSGKDQLPLTLSGIITGLAPGTTIWMDPAFSVVTGGTAIMESLGCSAWEVN